MNILDVWDPPIHTAPAAAERVDPFVGVLPDTLLAAWREHGFSGFGNGKLWLCDPVVWQPIVEAWTQGLNLPRPVHAVWRSCYGDVGLWSPAEPLARMEISAIKGTVLLSRDKPTTSSLDGQMISYLASAELQESYVIGEDGQPLFDRLLAHHGPVGLDTVYGFFPALKLGGPPRVENVEIVDADVHLQVLLDLAGCDVFTFGW